MDVQWWNPISWIGGAANAIGGWFGAKSSSDAAEKQVQGQREINAQQIAFARENMAWQEKMSNSAHQREVTDLRAAGLNPILSAKYGGSSTPVPIMPSIENPYGSYAGNKVASAKFASDALQFIPDIMLKAAQAKAALASSALTLANVPKVQEETKRIQGGYAANFLGTGTLSSVDNLIARAAQALGNVYAMSAHGGPSNASDKVNLYVKKNLGGYAVDAW